MCKVLITQHDLELTYLTLIKSTASAFSHISSKIIAYVLINQQIDSFDIAHVRFSCTWILKIYRKFSQNQPNILHGDLNKIDGFASFCAVFLHFTRSTLWYNNCKVVNCPPKGQKFFSWCRLKSIHFKRQFYRVKYIHFQFCPTEGAFLSSFFDTALKNADLVGVRSIS